LSWAARLASGAPVAERVAVVVAHADDETLWTGALLPRLGDGLLIHLTDSAPRDGGDAARLGIATREEYAALRAGELDRALVALGAVVERRGYGIADQEAVEHLPALADRLMQDCAGAAAIVTHPYEGGHPDHDAAALAARIAADRLGVPVVEFACYHLLDGERVFGRFWPGPDEQSRPLLPDERLAVAAALAEHASQRAVFGDWLPTAERWREAPRYDFGAPPPPGAALYDGFGWAMTSARWRAVACR
jgi:N-acetylglucosamine malate deacetylase 2